MLLLLRGLYLKRTAIYCEGYDGEERVQLRLERASGMEKGASVGEVVRAAASAELLRLLLLSYCFCLDYS